MILIDDLRSNRYRVPDHAKRPCLLCGLECGHVTSKEFLSNGTHILHPTRKEGTANVERVVVGPDCWERCHGALRRYVLRT